MTSNLGSDIILEGITSDGEISSEARSGVTALLKRSFRPEFLNRLDEIVFYKPLTKENIKSIIDLLIKDLSGRLIKKRLFLEITNSAKEYVIDAAYDPMYGARPLKKYLQSNIETLIARKIISEDISPETTITVDIENGKLVAR
jgi:ATP-dependent Clp protease ATP-binding subunit ClpB